MSVMLKSKTISIETFADWYFRAFVFHFILVSFSFRRYWRRIYSSFLSWAGLSVNVSIGTSFVCWSSAASDDFVSGWTTSSAEPFDGCSIRISGGFFSGCSVDGATSESEPGGNEKVRNYNGIRGECWDILKFG